MNVVALVAPPPSPDIFFFTVSTSLFFCLSLSLMSVLTQFLRLHSSFAQSVTDFSRLHDILMTIQSHGLINQRSTCVTSLWPAPQLCKLFRFHHLIWRESFTFMFPLLSNFYHPISMEPQCTSHLCVTTWHYIWLVTASFMHLCHQNGIFSPYRIE